MTAGQFKGALLEYLVRRLLLSCGFISVKPDGHYVYAQNGNGLFFINGKGAAHDADTLMEPPIQMPFTYPSQLLFECKAYRNSIGLGTIRNALGLRYDINEFEIVTDETIRLRKNNRRANYAIANRKRYNYQVGVASVEDFTKAAFEFAGNNKIPLLSLRWFLPDQICDLFHKIDEKYMARIGSENITDIYSSLKSKDIDIRRSHKSPLRSLIENDMIIGKILASFDEVVGSSFIGLIETGDILFLFASSETDLQVIEENRQFQDYRGRLHFQVGQEDIWELEIRSGNRTDATFEFRVPERIMRQWAEFNLDKKFAPNLKERFFSRIFVFTGQRNRTLPFFIDKP